MLGSQQMPQSKRETPGGSFDDSKGITEQLMLLAAEKGRVQD
jgi:hypothetical protein